MKFATISPDTSTIEIADYPDLQAAEIAAGLTPHAVDHGTVGRPVVGRGGVCIVVDERGLLGEPHYFSIHGSLYNGAAVLYAYDAAGETVDIEPYQIPLALWHGSVENVEKAISDGSVIRPQATVADKVIWSWTGAIDPTRHQS